MRASAIFAATLMSEEQMIARSVSQFLGLDGHRKVR